jgi:hypothetical protein
MRATENAAQAANLVLAFRPMIRNPHMRVGGGFHARILHQKFASKKRNRISGLSLMQIS